MFDRFTDAAKRTLLHSRQEALRLHCDRIDLPHLLLALLRQPEPELQQLLAELGVRPAAFAAVVEAVIPPGTAGDMSMQRLPFSESAKRAMLRAMGLAAELQHRHIDAAHLLLGIVSAATGPLAGAIRSVGLAVDALKQAIRDAGPPLPDLRRIRRARGFPLDKVTEMLAELQSVLADHARSAESVGQVAAGAVLRDGMQCLQQVVAKLRAIMDEP